MTVDPSPGVPVMATAAPPAVRFGAGRRPETSTQVQLAVFDGPLAPVPCASQTAYVPCADCPNEAVCGVHLAMKAVRDATARVLDGTSLASLRGQVEQATALTSTH